MVNANVLDVRKRHSFDAVVWPLGTAAIVSLYLFSARGYGGLRVDRYWLVRRRNTLLACTLHYSGRLLGCFFNLCFCSTFLRVTFVALNSLFFCLFHVVIHVAFRLCTVVI